MRNLPPWSVVLFSLAATPALAVDCATVGGNLVPGCGFESDGEVSAWTIETGESFTRDPEGQTGSAASGQGAEGELTTDLIVTSPCFAAAAGDYVASLALSDDSKAYADCTASVVSSSDPACGEVTSVQDFAAVTITLPAYVDASSPVTFPAGTVAASVTLSCTTGLPLLIVRVDNLVIAPVGVPAIAVPALAPFGAAALAFLVGVCAIAHLRRSRSSV